MQRKLKKMGNNSLELGRKQFRRGIFFLTFAAILLVYSLINENIIARGIGAFFGATSILTISLGIYNQYSFWRNAHEEVDYNLYGFPIYEDEK